MPGEAYELLLEYPHFVMHYNLPVALIGLLGLTIMAVMPLLKNRIFRIIPAQLLVLIVTIPLAMWMHIQQPTKEELAEKAAQPPAPAATTPAPADPHAAADPHATVAAVADPQAAAPADPRHSIDLGGQTWKLPPDKFLINVPTDFREAIVFPDFSALGHAVAWKWVLMFAVIASLESLLSAKAVDFIDPFHRKTDLNRDLLGCGVVNLISSCLGGLPIISEIVRSRANVDAGANTRLANVCHGLFLLLFAACFPFLLKMIPTAALAAMLTYTGFRLAHPREFFHMYQAGLEQLIVFITTIVAIVCTDLLIGVLVGMAMELAINVFRGLPLNCIFTPALNVRETQNGYVIAAQQAVVFSNWLGLRGKIEALGLKANKNLVVDLTETTLVDHTVMEKLAELEREFQSRNLKLELVGLEGHEAVSEHPTAARVRSA
jgi:MFS superfamily sulfate permease-like transporter